MPKELNAKHHLMVLMDAVGASTAEIAAELGYSPSTVSTLRSSPLYRAKLTDIKARLESASTTAVLDKITAEAGKCVETLIDLRDNGDGDVPPNVRLAAAKDLLDRVVPKKTDTSSEDRSVHIHLSSDDTRRLQGVLSEVRADVPLVRSPDGSFAAPAALTERRRPTILGVEEAIDLFDLARAQAFR